MKLDLTQAQTDAAGEFANLAMPALTQDGKVYPGTVVAGVARMAGTYLFRSLNLHLPGVQPGQAVLSAGASEGSPKLIGIAATALAMFGIRLDDSQAGVPTPPQHAPQLTFLETQARLEPAFAPVLARHGFSELEAAQSVAVAVALLIRHCLSALDANTAFNIAALGFVEGAKTAPDPVVAPRA